MLIGIPLAGLLAEAVVLGLRSPEYEGNDILEGGSRTRATASSVSSMSRSTLPVLIYELSWC